MSYSNEVEAALQDPRLLEQVYQTAQQAGRSEDFASEIARRYAASPDDRLIAAWYYRLHPVSPSAMAEAGTSVEAPAREGARQINWRLAIPLSLVLSLIYWVMTDPRFGLGRDVPLGAGRASGMGIPYLFLGWAPAAACLIILFMTVASRGGQLLSPSGNGFHLASGRRSLAVILAMVVITPYVTWRALPPHNMYRDLMLLHLPLLAWIAVGLGILELRMDDRNLFAGLIKSAEVVMAAGIYAGVAGVFVALTIGLFAAIGIRFPEALLRWLSAGVLGLIPVIAVATIYDPRLPPARQRFDQGLMKLLFTLGRPLLPLTLIVLILYILSILANFMRPFEQRDVLIVYNAMLFAIMGLLIAVTPLNASDVPEKLQGRLRSGMIAVAALTILISLYALSATVYRTVVGGLTVNRLTVMGWNVLNIAILGLFLYRQARYGRGVWVQSTHLTIRIGLIGYTLWTLFLILAIPWLFPGA